MQFQVPQFIDVEDKLFGPFTFKQFLYLVGGGAAAFALWKLLPFYIGIPLIVIVVGFALALTFYKVNGRSFILVLESAFNYYIGARLYIWKQPKVKKDEKKETATPEKPLGDLSYIPKLSNSRLKDISWSLDVLDMEKNKGK